MTQKDRMLQMVLRDQRLQEKYGYDLTEIEGMDDALHSDNAVVSAVAKIIRELNGSDDPGEQKRVYKTVFAHLNNTLLI